MQISAELRLFWFRDLPGGLEDWFLRPASHGFEAGGGIPREDVYLRDTGQVELGLKRRGRKPGIEVKGLVKVDPAGIAEGPFSGPIEVWTKWTSEPLELKEEKTVSLVKRRWLRKFEITDEAFLEIQLGPDEKPKDNRNLPIRGCNVELTWVCVRPDRGVWWTLGFESFGSLDSIVGDLRTVVGEMSKRLAPELCLNGQRASYPAWLNQVLSPEVCSGPPPGAEF